MWLKSLKQHFTTKKRTQQEAASSSLTAPDDEGDLVAPPTAVAGAQCALLDAGTRAWLQLSLLQHCSAYFG